MTCDFQQCSILKGVDSGVDSDEPVEPPFKLRNSKWCSVSIQNHRIFKRPAGLSLCAGWSEPLLVTHTTLLEISCHSSIIMIKHEMLTFTTAIRVALLQETGSFLTLVTSPALCELFTDTLTIGGITCCVCTSCGGTITWRTPEKTVR